MKRDEEAARLKQIEKEKIESEQMADSKMQFPDQSSNAA